LLFTLIQPPREFDIKFNVDKQVLSDYNLIVSDLLGKIVFEKFHSNESILHINLSKQENGLYFVKVFEEEGNYNSKKVIITN
jgi:Secretion system C-terminal sorting domain